MSKSKKSGGLSKIHFILGLTIFAFALPLTVKMVQQNQDKRSSAAGNDGDGSCLMWKEPYTNEEVYATNGSYLCGPGGGLFQNDGIYKCVNGKKVNQNINCNADGNNGCALVGKTLKSQTRGSKDQKMTYYQVNAKCRNDKGCTDLGGSCDVSIKNGPGVGGRCTTASGKDGIVKSELCLSKANYDTKRCCVPDPNNTYCQTSEKCKKIGGKCDNPKNKKSSEKVITGLCPGGSDCACIVKNTVSIDCKYNGKTYYNTYGYCNGKIAMTCDYGTWVKKDCGAQGKKCAVAIGSKAVCK